MKNKSRRGTSRRMTVFLSDGERGKWSPMAPEGDSGQVFCPKKRGIIAEGRCLKWQKTLFCGVECPNAVTDPKLVWKENPSKYFIDAGEAYESRGHGNYGKWETLKRLIRMNGGSINAYDVLSGLNLASYEAAAMMLRYYEKKELLKKDPDPHIKPQRYMLTKPAQQEESLQNPSEEKKNGTHDA